MDTTYKLTAKVSDLKVEADEIEDLLNRIPVGIYRSKIDGKIVYVNKFFKDLLEYDGRGYLSIKNLSYDRQYFFEIISKCGIVEDFTAQVVLNSGKVIHTIETARAIYNEKGEIEYIEGILTDITKFKTVQDALAESEEKYRLLFERSDDPILIIDGDKWYDCNDAALRILGLSSKRDLVGLSPYDISPPLQPDKRSSKDKALEYIREAYLKGYLRFDWVHRTLDGRDIYVDVSLTAIPYQKRTLLFTVFRDISHKVLAEQKIRENEEKFRLVFQNISDGIFLVNSAGDIIDANDAIIKITGYEKSEIINNKIWLVVSKIFDTDVCYNENDFKENFKKFTEISDLKIPEKDCIIKKKDGTLAYVNLKRQIINSSTGYILCNIIQDITELKQTTEALIQQKELYETLSKTAPITILLFDLDGNILFANEDFNSFFAGLEFDRSLIKSVYDLTNEQNHPKLKNAFEIILKQGYIRNLEIESRPFGGKIIEVEINASLLSDKYGNPTSIIATVIDIGARKQAERVREQAMKATIEAMNTRQEAAEIIHNTARLASIGVIAGGIVHEISQPLNAIRIGSEGILTWNSANGNPLPSAVVNMIQGITRATMRIDEIIQHMRSLWIGSNTDVEEIVDLNSCVRSAMNITKMRVQSHEIIFDISLSESPVNIKANHVHMELIVNNLITNSINSLDQTNKPNKTIRIVTNSSGKYAYLIVYDNGIGLPNVKTEKLFDPFFSTRHNSGGTGLGLAIVKMFVDKYKGSIQPMNNQDGGATFIISFPIADLDNNEQDSNS